MAYDLIKHISYRNGLEHYIILSGIQKKLG